MNFIENESATKLRGGFYTDPAVAAFLNRWVLAGQPKSVLEPSCGDGAFLVSLIQSNAQSLQRIVGWELDPEEAAKAAERTRHSHSPRVEVRVGDFLQWFVAPGRESVQFDAVVGNPPFIRYQYLDLERQRVGERIFSQFGLSFTMHTNAWVPFVIAALALLAPGGRLAMVIPSELLHIRHAGSLRRYLLDQCASIVVLDPEELLFGDALQGVVLLLAQKRSSPRTQPARLAVHTLRSRDFLRCDPEVICSQIPSTPCTGSTDKWMALLLDLPERALLNQLAADPGFVRFQNIAEVDVGIVTGANSFFLVPDEVVERFGLHRWAYPMFGRSDHVRGMVYRPSDHENNRRAGLPAHFLWFDDADIHTFPESVQEYFRVGVAQGLPHRYKCRVREPWFRVPSVSTTPVAMLKRAHHFPRLILNAADAFTTDTAYRVKIKEGTEVSWVYASFNTLTCLSAELEGRHYGGGVLELVPSEIERLLLPRVTAEARDLDELDRRYRSCADPTALLQSQDTKVLRAVGLTSSEISLLQNAWGKLKLRRQRKPNPSDSSGAATEPSNIE